MKHFRRLLAVALAVLCVLSLVACGGNTSTDEFTYGDTGENVYKNSFVGIQVTAPDNWVFLTDEQIATVAGQVADAFPDVDAFKKSNSAEKIVMYLVDSETSGTDSINLTLAKGGIFTSLDKTVEVNKQTLKTTYEQMGLTTEFSNDEKVTLGGVEFTSFTMTGDFMGIKFSQYCYFAMKDKYVCVIAATDYSNLGRGFFENTISAYTK